MSEDIQYDHNYIQRKWNQLHWEWRGRFSRNKLYLPIARWRHAHVYLKDDTEIVIEGFPRSGNTFAMTAFEFAQGRPCSISSHIHASSVIKRAIERGIPVIVLVRKPVDAAISFEIMLRHSVPASQGLAYYARFYEDLLPFRDSIVIASFETATSDFGKIIDAVNEKYSTSFKTFDHTDENVERCFEIIDQEYKNWRGQIRELNVSRPSDQRKLVKQRIMESLMGNQHSAIRERADRIYRTFLEQAL